MNIALELTGMTPLVQRNDRLADPDDDFAKQIAAIAGKRKKTEEDHAEIAHLEFLGGLYHDPDIGVYLPTWNVVRCLEKAGVMRRLGTALVQAISMTSDKVALEYDGPRKPPELWEKTTFRFRKAVGINGKRVMRMRPMFRKWSLCLQAEMLTDVLDVEDLRAIAQMAGRSIGLGDARKLGYGRFVATVISEEGA